MPDTTESITLLIADDDPDDCLLAKDALAESRLLQEVEFVSDGEQLLAYLRREGRFAHLAQAPYPQLILLDLNMPRKDGREVLREIKEDRLLRPIPVVIFTTSEAEEDILDCYLCGASSYITKPSNFDGLVIVMRSLKDFWLETASLPSFGNAD